MDLDGPECGGDGSCSASLCIAAGAVPVVAAQFLCASSVGGDACDSVAIALLAGPWQFRAGLRGLIPGSAPRDGEDILRRGNGWMGNVRADRGARPDRSDSFGRFCCAWRGLDRNDCGGLLGSTPRAHTVSSAVDDSEICSNAGGVALLIYVPLLLAAGVPIEISYR